MVGITNLFLFTELVLSICDSSAANPTLRIHFSVQHRLLFFLQIHSRFEPKFDQYFVREVSANVQLTDIFPVQYGISGA